MKKKILLMAGNLVLLATLFAQTQKFDIASFIPPQGWQRLDSNGKLGFFDAKTTDGGTHFCQILLYPSRASSGNAVKDFNEEWKSRVVKATGYTKKPGMQTKRSPDGWNIVTGYANINQQGSTYTCTLTSISGFGKVMSVLVNIAGQDYLPFVDQFFKNLVLDKNTAVHTPSNNQTTVRTGVLADYSFTAPQGWTAMQYPDGIVLSPPVSNTGERCNITLWPMRPSTGNLQDDANNLFAVVFKDFEPRNGSTAGSMIRGFSPQGWEYFITKKSIGLRGGDYQVMFGFAFVARLGNQVAAISGISKDPLVSSCFGLQLTDVWPKFFYSLQFKNWQAPSQSEAANRLPGVWTAVTASAGDRFAFAPNGRFAGAAAAQRYVRLSSVDVLRITDAYFGDGAYRMNGNSILLTHDSNKSTPEAAWFRIEQESRDEGRTWTEKLYLLRKSEVDGSEFEVAYDKQQ
jgi:hypothetical protein